MFQHLRVVHTRCRAGCGRETRNHADLYRTISVLLGSAVCSPMHVQGGDCTDRWISARSRHCPTKLRLETVVGAQSVLPRRAREARNHADLYRTIWVLSGSAVCGPMGSVRTGNHADLYRTIWVLSGFAVCGPMGSVRTPGSCTPCNETAQVNQQRFDFGVLDTQHLVCF